MWTLTAFKLGLLLVHISILPTISVLLTPSVLLICRAKSNSPGALGVFCKDGVSYSMKSTLSVQSDHKSVLLARHKQKPIVLPKRHPPLRPPRGLEEQMFPARNCAFISRSGVRISELPHLQPKVAVHGLARRLDTLPNAVCILHVSSPFGSALASWHGHMHLFHLVGSKDRPHGLRNQCCAW